jgi:predicted glycosyltransferase involved in capsule biosynthesis
MLEWLNIFDFEVIIIEQDTIQKLDPESLKETNSRVKHKFVKSGHLFNRAWGFNVATKFTDSDILFYADADTIMNPEEILKSVSLFDTYQCISPFLSLIDLPLHITNRIDIPKFDYNNTYGLPIRGGINMCSNIVGFTREGINKVNGWDERFEGWGGDDDIQSIKSQELLKCLIMPTTAYHLHHSRSTLNGTNQHPNYTRNLHLALYYSAHPKQLVKDTIELKNNGEDNKYE